MSKLVIVESPGKIKKIKSYLGTNYNVMASVGHIRDLIKSYNAIDYKNNFQPKYEILKDKINVVNNLKKACKYAKEIYIASDDDREGEAIAYHLIEVLKLKSYKRITFNEITQKAIIYAISNPRKLDIDLVNAQQTRRILDRIIGFNLSPLLKKIENIDKNTGLGIGRVQSVVLRLIVEKEKDIQKFNEGNNKSIYNAIGKFKIDNLKLKGYNEYYKLIEDNIKINNYNLGQNIPSHVKIFNLIKTELDMEDLIFKIRLEPKFFIKDIKRNDKYKNPSEPYITSTLQQDALIKLNFNIKKTMQIAQKLYEKGLITYMRTDSTFLSDKILEDIKQKILIEYGTNYYRYKQYKLKNGAHEAIRPTNINTKNIEDIDENKLYNLIWKRTIASQMQSAKYLIEQILLENKLFIRFYCNNEILIFDGYLKLYNVKENNKIVDIIKLDSKVKWKEIIIKETYKNPPMRYNEATLVKKLESLGIGRPSTYASIISKVEEHNYIQNANINGKKISVLNLILQRNLNLIKKEKNQLIGKDCNKLIPTNNGYLVIDFLIRYFTKIIDYKFTAELENFLDNIALGKSIWFEVLKKFYEEFILVLNLYRKKD